MNGFPLSCLSHFLNKSVKKTDRAKQCCEGGHRSGYEAIQSLTSPFTNWALSSQPFLTDKLHIFREKSCSIFVNLPSLHKDFSPYSEQSKTTWPRGWDMNSFFKMVRSYSRYCYLAFTIHKSTLFLLCVQCFTQSSSRMGKGTPWMLYQMLTADSIAVEGLSYTFKAIKSEWYSIGNQAQYPSNNLQGKGWTSVEIVLWLTLKPQGIRSSLKWRMHKNK